MNESSIVSIRNAVIAAVIAGILLWMILVPAIKEYFVRLISWLWYGLLWCWKALMAPYSLPGWFILILFALAGMTIVSLIAKALVDESPYASYVKDTIYGVEWRWRWVENRVSNLWCYCPRCDATLVYNDRSHFYEKTDFICENCDHSVITSITGGSKDHALGVVTREIGRRIRTGSAKGKLEQFSPMDGEK